MYISDLVSDLENGRLLVPFTIERTHCMSGLKGDEFSFIHNSLRHKTTIQKEIDIQTSSEEALATLHED